MNKLLYPKTYCTVVKIEVVAERRKDQGIAIEKRIFTPDEWDVVSRRIGKRRWWRKDVVTTVVTDAGETILLDYRNSMIGGCGHRGRHTRYARRKLIGTRLKLYHHPKDKEGRWRYKYLGT